jgi:Ala-tRNA(Pro) deacylase
MSEDIFKFLASHHIPYERFDHPPLFTCEDAKKHDIHLRGADTKNLFLRDKKGTRHFLTVCPHDTRVDLASLSQKIGAEKLSFGSSERLKKYLGVEPGSVSILGLITDKDHLVEVFIDERVWESDEIQAHPLINTSTLVIPKSGIIQFLEITGHNYQIISL